MKRKVLAHGEVLICALDSCNLHSSSHAKSMRFLPLLQGWDLIGPNISESIYLYICLSELSNYLSMYLLQGLLWSRLSR